MRSQLKRIKQSYNRDVKKHRRGVDPWEVLPRELRNSPEIREFRSRMRNYGSGAYENREFLQPREGQRFLDIGSAANLVVHELHQWPCLYYGVDISPRMVEAMQQFVETNEIEIGGLWVAEAADLPFQDSFFHRAEALGVFEYAHLRYIRRALKEIDRVVKNGARLIVDIPDVEHEQFPLLARIEAHRDRPVIPTSQEEFEAALKQHFTIEDRLRRYVMLKYFLTKK